MYNKFFTLNTKSLKDAGVESHQELWNKVKGEYKGFQLTSEVEIKKVEENRFTFVLSTADRDRHGDIVVQEWNLKNFKKNPVVLDSHRYNSIEDIIGKMHKARNEDGKLKGDVEFFLESPRGMLAYKQVQGGFLNTGSVGFIPDFDEQGNMYGGELLEYSMVSVPANASALHEKSLEEPEEEVIEETPEATVEEVVEEVIEETPETITEKTLAQRLADEMAEKNTRLKRIAEELQKTTPETLAERKRRIFKDLRVLISQDKE